VTTFAGPKPGYNFNMAALLKTLRAYHPSKARVDLETDQDSKNELEHIATYVSMKDNSIVTNIVAAGRKRNVVEDFALVVETQEEPCKVIGTLGRQYAIVSNVAALIEENTSQKVELRELKRELVGQKKLTIDMQVANLTVEDIRKQISLNTGNQAVKEEWIKETKEAIQELFLGITNFFIEKSGSFVMQGRIQELIARRDNSYQVMHDLRRKTANMPILLEYCHQFFYQYDWLFYGISKCQDFIQIRTKFQGGHEETANRVPV